MKQTMPDVVESKSARYERVLDWVGMSEVETTVELGSGEKVLAKAHIYVDLIDTKAKGIHMSRLYLALSKCMAQGPLTQNRVEELLTQVIQDQGGKSMQAKIELSFDLPLKRKALLSDTYGERHYPVTLQAIAVQTQEKTFFEFELGFKVLYSSTCPCSAALSRQLIQNKWKKEGAQKQNWSFDEVTAWLEEESFLVATPHAQRSEAHIKVMPENLNLDQLQKWVPYLESEVLKTPVQTAVKREDEQEFARLNAANLMFCEDVARRVARWLDQEDSILGYWARMDHRESLHAHNAVSEVSKNWRM